MTVFVLVREDQNAHGYVDTSVAGIYRDKQATADQESVERLQACADGLIVEDGESPDGEWQVAWRVEEHDLS